MNILVQLSHPAHFHSFKLCIRNWQADGHKVYVLIKTKDILENLMQESSIPYYNILPVAHRKSKMGVFMDMLIRDWKIFWFCIKHHINMLVGSTPEVAQIAWLLRRYSVNIGEDDAAIIPAFIHVTKPFLKCFAVPLSCAMGVIENKAVHYPGFQKLAYLHPNYFTPNKEIVRKNGIDPNQPYFLLRFASLKAHHDNGVLGISTEVAQHLIDMLLPYGKIYITAERPLEPQFEQYRLHINPLDIHHVMAYATIYIGDSQSMANEAAMLGTPSLRFNDFVGEKKIGVMEELEHVYGLTYGISSHEPEQLYAKIEELLAMPNLREEFQARRQRMLVDKIDVTAFLTWFIENYPASKNQAKQANEEFWQQFK